MESEGEEGRRREEGEGDEAAEMRELGGRKRHKKTKMKLIPKFIIF